MVFIVKNTTPPTLCLILHKELYDVRERMLLIKETSHGEKIFIQYPGKETISNIPDKIRPWDFRPKLLLPDGSFMNDLSFANIWDDLDELGNVDNTFLSILATIFFRMAFMVDTSYITYSYPVEDIDANTGRIVGTGAQFLSWYSFNLAGGLLEYLESIVGNIRGVSIEAYLCYNDLLVQNEDCNYYYKDTVIVGNQWKSKVGRRNILMTHISLIEYLQGNILFSNLMNRFQRGRGVAPIPLKYLPNVSNGLIVI